MKVFRILQRLHALWTSPARYAADLPVKLDYPRGHGIRRDLVTAICQDRLHVLRLKTRGDCEVLKFTLEAWRDYVAEAVESKGARVTHVPWEDAPDSAGVAATLADIGAPFGR
jgi:hypothetical protein